MNKYLTLHAVSYNENSHYLLQSLTGVTQLYKVRCKGELQVAVTCLPAHVHP
jgi:hypothetical protein